MVLTQIKRDNTGYVNDIIKMDELFVITILKKFRFCFA
jgi:hypothetical protein